MKKPKKIAKRTPSFTPYCQRMVVTYVRVLNGRNVKNDGYTKYLGL